MADLRFFLVDLGLSKKVAVVAEEQRQVSEWALTKASAPKITAMTNTQRKRWRGATIYLDEVPRSKRR